ncbi:MAG TPA: hypothetical protein VGQ11_05005 [Candidatus Acidoferrales bacterium]|jgi:hypothetical protein|nr:hypothetical protein [Candidatus Acidoferrales bacterium]
MRKLLTVFVALAFAAGLVAAQEKAAKKKPAERKITGEIIAVDDAKSTMTVTKGNEKFVVAFNDSTKWTKQEAKKAVGAERSEFKVGSIVICLVKADEQGHWVATRIDLRPAHSH